MCGAIGAWFAMSPLIKEDVGNGITKEGYFDRKAICIIGDGGLQMNIQEFQTIKNYNVNVKIFIINNHSYGITKAYQKVNFEGRNEACEEPHYTVPDFKKIAEAYGINSYSIRTDAELKRIKTLIDIPHPAIIDVDCGKWHEYYPKIVGWKTPIEDMAPYLRREEFINNMIIPPMEGWKGRNYK
jgi:acetolactate synthase-1/2/3 large subunit